MSTPSLDLFWPRDVVGRTIGEHPFGNSILGPGMVYCRGCAVAVPDSSQHLMFALLAAVERLRSDPPEAAAISTDQDLDRRESQIVWGKS